MHYTGWKSKACYIVWIGRLCLCIYSWFGGVMQLSPQGALINTQMHLCSWSLTDHCHQFTCTLMCTHPPSPTPTCSSLYNYTQLDDGLANCVSLQWCHTVHSKRTYPCWSWSSMHSLHYNTTFIGQDFSLSILCIQELCRTPNIWEVYYMDCMQTFGLHWHPVWIELIYPWAFN